MVDKILVVDYEDSNAEMLKKLLEEHRFVVEKSLNLDIVLGTIEENNFGLVIFDFKTADVKAAEFLEKLRNTHPNLPIILVTGLMNTQELVSVANLGVNRVFEKPLNIDEFISSVQDFVSPLSKEDYAFSVADTSAGSGNASQTEARLQSGLSEYTYPADLQYLSGNGKAMRDCLQQLWTLTEAGKPACVVHQPGAELELIMREIQVWRQQPSKPIKFVQASTFVAPEFAAGLDAPEPGSLLGIIGLEVLDSDQLQMIGSYFSGQASAFSTVYFVESGWLKAARQNGSPELLDSLLRSACYLPSLSQRTVDLSIYIRKYLELIATKEGILEKVEIEEDAASLLLNYSWPNNFVELISVIRRVVRLGRKGPLQASEIKFVFNCLGVNDLNYEIQLETILLARQQSFLQQEMAHTNSDPETLLKQVGVEPGVLNGKVSVDELSLLFPELLKH